MIRLVEVTKTFGNGTSALSDVSLTIDKGEFVFLVGPSGSGKTTLLRLLIREMLPTKGIITIGDWNLVELPNNKVPHLRRRIGFVFQDLKILMDRTIYENIMLPLEMSDVNQNEAKQKVEQILEQVGLLEHAHKFPIQLSGGELQRAAIARALVFSPEILLADEPTGNLDNTTSWEIVKLLNDINKSGTTVIMATHNLEVVSSLGKRTVTLEKGKVIKDQGKNLQPKDQKEKEREGKDAPKKEDDAIKKSKEGEKDADN
ncbi:MAG: cell division ATP-binding protein FtsE [Patescibacteria group bacterium]|nr:MAG: cell division ATP-binding protein FtsE [Patescibacteria group bacterium]